MLGDYTSFPSGLSWYFISLDNQNVLNSSLISTASWNSCCGVVSVVARVPAEVQVQSLALELCPATSVAKRRKGEAPYE